MNGYLVVNLKTGQLISAHEAVDQFGLQSPDGRRLDGLYLGGVVYALQMTAAGVVEDGGDASQSLSSLETSETSIQFAVDSQTKTMAVVLTPTTVSVATRGWLAEQVLQMHQAPEKPSRRALKSRLELRLACDVADGFGEGLRPAWIIVSQTSSTSKRDQATTRPDHLSQTSIIPIGSYSGPRRRRPRLAHRLLLCCSATDPGRTEPMATSPTSNLTNTRVLQLSEKEPPLTGPDFDRISSSIDAAAALLQVDEGGSNKATATYRAMQLNVPQRTLVVTRGPALWIAIPIAETDTRPLLEILSRVHDPLMALTDALTNRKTHATIRKALGGGL
ncbi:Roadblock/LAMTOR2 domain-containing protein [Plasmodiophora brassicae]